MEPDATGPGSERLFGLLGLAAAVLLAAISLDLLRGRRPAPAPASLGDGDTAPAAQDPADCGCG